MIKFTAKFLVQKVTLLYLIKVITGGVTYEKFDFVFLHVVWGAYFSSCSGGFQTLGVGPIPHPSLQCKVFAVRVKTSAHVTID